MDQVELEQRLLELFEQVNDGNELSELHINARDPETGAIQRDHIPAPSADDKYNSATALMQAYDAAVVFCYLYQCYQPQTQTRTSQTLAKAHDHVQKIRHKGEGFRQVMFHLQVYGKMP